MRGGLRVWGHRRRRTVRLQPSSSPRRWNFLRPNKLRQHSMRRGLRVQLSRRWLLRLPRVGRWLRSICCSFVGCRSGCADGSPRAAAYLPRNTPQLLRYARRAPRCSRAWPRPCRLLEGTPCVTRGSSRLPANCGRRSSPGRRSRPKGLLPRRRSQRSVPGLGTDPGPSSSSAALRSTSSHVHAAADACASSRSSPRRRRCAASSAVSASRPTLLLGPQRGALRTGGAVCCDAPPARCRSRSRAIRGTRRRGRHG